MVDGPLKGLKVLDLTHVWAGPLAVRFMADLGAEVVKVEAADARGPQVFPAMPIGGWLGGAPGAEPWNVNAAYNKLGRNRRSMAIDLKQSLGRETFLQLVAEADVVIENFSAQTMRHLNLDYDVLRQTNPRIIYVHMPGFGGSGLLRDRVAFGPTVEAMSGLTLMLGYGPNEPRNTAMALMDPIAASNTFAGLTVAIRRRERTGLGVRMEVSLHEGGVSYSGPWLADLQLGESPESLGNAHPNMAPHGVYRCAGEDEWAVIACTSQDQWLALCDMLLDELGHKLPSDLARTVDDITTLRHLDLLDRLANRELLDAWISQWTKAAGKHEVVARVQSMGVAAGAVNAMPDMLADEQVQARNFFVPYEVFDTPMPGNPLHLAELDSAQWQRCPKLGEHNAEVLNEWLGYGREEVQTLVEKGVLHDKPPA